MFSGKNIFNFGTPERLQTLRCPIFTERNSCKKGLGNAVGVSKSLLSYNITRRVNCPSLAAKLVRPPYRSEMAQMLRTPSP
ncbi:MAG TPA: hypothetical protein DCR80_05195 [Faecalibacterium sp.]|nr:hypothetical protein [Faecalibacterium sp.]